MKLLKKLSASLTAAALACAAMPLSALAITNPTTGEEIVMDAVIALNGTSAEATGSNVTVDGTKITITQSGAYEFSGTLDDGQIIVNIADEVADAGTVKLYFNGVNITGQSAAAVYVINAENTSINLVDGTENFLSDGDYYDDTATGTNAVIYAKDDITIKGEGSLRVDAVYNYGLHCNNDVKINGGTIKFKTSGTLPDDLTTATTRGDAIRGKTSVEIKEGVIDINAAGDGVKSTKGDVFINGGATEIKAGNDAVQGETSLSVTAGSLKANGDRGLTCAAVEGVSISGGTVVATATDYQPATVTATQPTVLFDLTEEVAKDNLIALTADGSDTAAVQSNPDKKFSYLLVSAPSLELNQTYTLSIGGNTATKGDASTFTLTGDVTRFAAIEPNVPAAVETVPNDVNGDGNVTIADAVLLARIIAEDNTLVLNGGEIDRSDVDGSGILDADDLTYLLRTIAGLV